jgi:hypothetical protein
MASEFKNTEAFIKKYGKEVEEEIKSRLLTYDKKASGKLYRSIKFNYRESIKQLEASWRMEDYGLYVDKGVKPQPKYLTGKGTGKKSKFITALKKWCKIRGLPEGAAYPIRINIWKYGIAPTNFFTIPTRRRNKYYEKKVEENLALDIDTQLQKELDKK